MVWVGSLDAWLVTGHDLCVEVMLDPETFTVENPRFSTQQVIGPSMLSLDGIDHRRHRESFAWPFRAGGVAELGKFIEATAADLVHDLVTKGSGDLRADVAGQLAVTAMARVLDLEDVDVSDVLSWYRDIVDAVHTVTAGGPVPDSGVRAFHDLKHAVIRNHSSSSLLGVVEETGDLTVDEIVSNVAVLLFGGIVTSESSSAIAFRYLLENPRTRERIEEEPALVRPFVEETFRLEPSAAAVDRYATRDVDLGSVSISEGDLVRVSLSAANRDPAVFGDPDQLDIHRSNLGKSVTFARGPHACLGIHLARLETAAAIDALLAHPSPTVPDDLDPVEGLVFRVPATVQVTFP